MFSQVSANALESLEMTVYYYCYYYYLSVENLSNWQLLQNAEQGAKQNTHALAPAGRS